MEAAHRQEAADWTINYLNPKGLHFTSHTNEVSYQIAQRISCHCLPYVDSVRADPLTVLLVFKRRMTV